jgi:hypothetical protein
MIGRRSSVAGFVSFMILTALGGCGGGGGGGGGDAKVLSEALVPDNPSGCAIEAEVDTGDDVHDVEGLCIVFVDFHLFDTAGNELGISRPLFSLRPEQSVSLHLQICRGEIAPAVPEVEVASDRTSLFLIPDADHCPSGPTAPGPVGDVPLQRPLAEVSCEQISRLQTEVLGCGE